jgi:hypothetical protein
VIGNNEYSATTGLPKPVALGQSVNSNVAPVARVVGHPFYRLYHEQIITYKQGNVRTHGKDEKFI